MLQYSLFENLSEKAKEIVKADDYVCYVRIYYRNGYGSAFFFKGTNSGYIDEIENSEKRGKERYTEILKSELQKTCEQFCEEMNPNGRKEMYETCKNLVKEEKCEESDYYYTTYHETVNSLFQISVSKEDEYFLRIYAFRKDEE